MSRLVTPAELYEMNNPPKQNSRLTKDSAAVAKLIEKLEKKKFTGTEDPKTVWLADPLFRQHKLNNFRTCYHNIKAKYLEDQTQVDIIPEAINRMSSEAGPSPKRAKVELDDTIETFQSPVHSAQRTERSFTPLYLMSTWQKPGTTTKRIAIAVILPSGVGVGDFKIRVIEDGDVLEMIVNWPNPLSDIHFMHKKWLVDCSSDFTDFRPKFLGFESALISRRSDVYTGLSSTSHIGLPFTVQTHIVSIQNIAYKYNQSKMVYIDLRAIAEEYATLKNTESFEII